MAECDAYNISNAEIDLDAVLSVDISDFVKSCVFPQCVCVTDGNFLSRGVQISVGDVLQLNSCDSGQVTLSYRNESNHLWIEVSVDLDYPQKFRVLPPKDVDINKRVSVVMYPTISDLMLDCPTYFEATSSYDDPYLPAMSVRVGDRFWFVQIVRNSKEGVDRLKVRDTSDNILFLSLECRGNFSPLKDDNEYTVKELVELASVPRRLEMVQVNKEPDPDDGHDGKHETVADERTADEYTVVVKPGNKRHGSASSSFSSLSSPVNMLATTPSCLPSSFSGIIHLLKYESAVVASPYNDPETTWTIPVSANLKVRTYYQDDYEVPAPRNQVSHTRVPLPISHDKEVPKFRAPSTPPMQQPCVPININSFVDIYCSTFPVKAKILDAHEAHPFFQAKLSTEDVIVYRLDDTRRLYVKDIQRDDVYSLSHDLKLSFIEYPEKFRTISELLHLPVGTDITVLEDIAADFPKPFSLRFGDVLRLTSNTPYFIKMKHLNRDCQVIKCERVDSNAGENTKLKLPMDFEVSMVMTVDSNSRRMISLQDLLSGVVAIPNQSVASVPDASEGAVLKDLPVDLRILKSMKETCIVVAPETGRKFTSMSSLNSCSSSDSGVSSKEKTSAHSSRQEQVLLTNIGLPLTSGIVLAFRDRLDLCELDVKESEADYLRLPVEKMTMAQFEERERLRKLNSDYEDFEFGSNSTLDECGSGSNNIMRANSTGVLDKKPKNTAKDKMLRLSRALNPKHWRHSKAEPEPLPHPSAMGLMALAARPKDDVSNEYHHTKMGSCKSELGTSESIVSSSEEEENFYEYMEIGPLRSSTIAATSARQTGAFSGPTHKSLPPRVPAARISDHRSHGVFDSTSYPAAASDTIEEQTSRAIGNTEMHTYDVPKPFIKAKNWATNIGNTIGERFNSKPRYDVPKSCVVKEETEQITKPSVPTSVDRRPSDIKSPLPPPSINKKALGLTEQKDAGSPPIPPSRRKDRKPSSWVNNPTKNQNNQEQEKLPKLSISKSISLNDSISSTNEIVGVPKPKPRGLKSPVSSEESTSHILQLQQSKSTSENIVKSVEALSVDAHHSLVNAESSPFVVANNTFRPKPPPKPKVSTHTTV